MSPRPETWLEVHRQGLFVKPGGFWVDPVQPVPRAVITHGHSDHARGGHGTVIATAETLDIMAVRLGPAAGQVRRALAFGEVIGLGEVRIWLVPAGHVLGSAQIVLEHRGCRVVVSGDYKRRPDPTCPGFEPVPCDLFVTEATFGLPIFCHPATSSEIAKLLRSVALFTDRCHVIGAYALGKTQRLIRELRAAGWDRPIYIHGALLSLCELYARHAIDLGELRPATAGIKGEARKELQGQIVIAPPAAVTDRWARRLPDPVVCLASGWMRVKQRARQRGVELPLVISDHADWNELLETLEDVQAPEVWVTHGREEALVHAATGRGIRARALALVGYEEEDQ